MNEDMSPLRVSEILPIPPQCSDVTTVVRQVIVGPDPRRMTAAPSLYRTLIQGQAHGAKPVTCTSSFKFHNSQGVRNIFSLIL